MIEDNKMPQVPHNVVMEDRQKISLTGVNDVDSFDEQSITAYTDVGELTISGKELHIAKLNIDSGEMCVDGLINSLVYSDEKPQQGGFFSKVFR